MYQETNPITPQELQNMFRCCIAPAVLTRRGQGF